MPFGRSPSRNNCEMSARRTPFAFGVIREGNASVPPVFHFVVVALLTHSLTRPRPPPTLMTLALREIAH